MKKKPRAVRSPPRIVVEVLTSAESKRLESLVDELRAENRALEKRIEGLHKTFYEFLESLRATK